MSALSFGVASVFHGCVIPLRSALLAFSSVSASSAAPWRESNPKVITSGLAGVIS